MRSRGGGALIRRDQSLLSVFPSSMQRVGGGLSSGTKSAVPRILILDLPSLQSCEK